MNIKKTVKALLIINGLQFVAAFLLWLVIGSQVLGRVNPAIYLTIGIMLLSSLLTIMGLYMASRYPVSYTHLLAGGYVYPAKAF